MSSGPIEFLGEESRDDMPHSEYGGGAGLVQTDPEGERRQTAGESLGMMARAGRRVLSPREAWTGEADGEDGVVVDPHTGLAVDEDNNMAGEGVKLSEVVQSKLVDG